MCGIVGGTAQRDIAPILLEGLKRLEYRGYDSAGIAVIGYRNGLQRNRALGKVVELEAQMEAAPVGGGTGVAHTRWATHGVPSKANAHPHIAEGRIALVHNGIIENHAELREQQKAKGYRFTSETDTEVVVHQVHYYCEAGDDVLDAVRKTINDIQGAYALGVIDEQDPQRLIASRSGSPLVIGVGIGETFIASDVAALLPVTQRFIYLEEGDIADIKRDELIIYSNDGSVVEREIRTTSLSVDAADKGEYRHYMLKEIYEQPKAITDTLEGRIANNHLLEAAFGPAAETLFEEVKAIQIIACGTSYHSGMVAKYWFESLVGIRCHVEIASEFRYRQHVIDPGTLFVTISQSGETADTLAALRQSVSQGYLGSLAICNVPESSLIRESDLSMMTRAGPEIGVASTKAFTTQLVALLLLVIAVGKKKGMTDETETSLVQQLMSLPRALEKVLKLDAEIEQMAEQFSDKHNALFLGRGHQFPIAMEGALKLKEISYIHAEAYAAGELKHGPLALIDADMPVIAVAPNDELLDKLKSNLEEVRARGGKLYVFADNEAGMDSTDEVEVIHVASDNDCVSPIVYTIPLQLLSYHVAVLKGTDVDQPRNLAKSVTVE